MIQEAIDISEASDASVVIGAIVEVGSAAEVGMSVAEVPIAESWATTVATVARSAKMIFILMSSNKDCRIKDWFL